MENIKNFILERKIELFEKLEKSNSSVEKRILKAKIGELSIILEYIKGWEAEEDDQERS